MCGIPLSEAAGQSSTRKHALYYEAGKDSIHLYVTAHRFPLNKANLYRTVYYLDAALPSGRKLRELLEGEHGRPHLKDVLFIGIAHPVFRQKTRERDFVPGLFRGKEGAAKSEADNFYRFLEEAVLPFVEGTYGTRDRGTLVGHSLGGLFTLYALVREDRLVRQYVALGPALWAGRFTFFRREKQFRHTHPALPARLFVSAGKQEVFNLILPGTRMLKQRLTRNPYEGLNWEYREYPRKGHHSQVPEAFKELLQQDWF
jgi:predicted alpha/beta superfamily hydrolase